MTSITTSLLDNLRHLNNIYKATAVGLENLCIPVFSLVPSSPSLWMWVALWSFAVYFFQVSQLIILFNFKDIEYKEDTESQALELGIYVYYLIEMLENSLVKTRVVNQTDRVK